VAPVPSDDAAFAWSPGVPSPALPISYNPDAGFLVSANNVPTPTTEPLVPQGNSNDRIARMTDLLAAQETVTMEKLAELQLDTLSIAARAAADALIQRLADAELSSGARALLDELAEWNGRHDVATVGAAAWQRVLDRLISALYEDRYAEPIRNTIRSGPYVHDFVREDLQAADLQTLVAAIESAARHWKPNVAWGEIHRLRVAHPLGNVPLVGGWYSFGDYPYAGSTTTILKAAHGVGDGRHNTRFGANARILMDMGTLDDNRVVLLGGQDGHMGSDRLVSQIPLWLDGGYVPLPLSAEAQAEAAVTTLRLAPASQDE
jgi:penicillin amidase